MHYRALFFDADDTLFDYPAAEKAALQQCVLQFGIDARMETLLASYRAHNAAVWQAFERGELSQRELRVERFRRLARELPMPGLELEELSDAYLQALSGQSHVYDGAETFIAELAVLAPLAIVTNGIAAVQRGRFALAPFMEHFSAVVISEEAGFAKPDPRIFDGALDALGVTAADVLFIGDGVSSDMAAAQNAGMDFCWYNPAGLPVPDGHAPRFIARDYDEIRVHLGLI